MFNSKLAKWFLAWVVLMVAIIIVFQPESRPEKIDSVSFNTNEADELYFKNVRLFYYSTNEEGGGAFEVHRLNSLKDVEELILPFAIYHSWRANEAFIRLDTAFTNYYHGAVLLKDSAGVQLSISELPDADNVSQYVFAKVAFKALREKSKLGIKHNGKEIWLTETGSKSVRQCLKDYFKLTGKL
jgi:hypothetical protein